MIQSEYLADKNGRIIVFDIADYSTKLERTNEICGLLYADMSMKSVENTERLCMCVKQQGVYIGIIYCYTNINNGKKYVGQTINPRQRFHHHLSLCKDKNSIWHKVLRRYGLDNFHYHILSIVITDTKGELQEKLNAKEAYYIDSMRSSVKEWGYNVAQGGLCHFNNESRKRIGYLHGINTSLYQTHHKTKQGVTFQRI